MKTLTHSGHIIVERKHCADLIDPTTGRWRTYQSVRAAKWWATIHARIAEDFGEPIRISQQSNQPQVAAH